MNGDRSSREGSHSGSALNDEEASLIAQQIRGRDEWRMDALPNDFDDPVTMFASVQRALLEDSRNNFFPPECLIIPTESTNPNHPRNDSSHGGNANTDDGAATWQATPSRGNSGTYSDLSSNTAQPHLGDVEAGASSESTSNHPNSLSDLLDNKRDVDWETEASLNNTSGTSDMTGSWQDVLVQGTSATANPPKPPPSSNEPDSGMNHVQIQQRGAERIEHSETSRPRKPRRSSSSTSRKNPKGRDRTVSNTRDIHPVINQVGNGNSEFQPEGMLEDTASIAVDRERNTQGKVALVPQEHEIQPSSETGQQGSVEHGKNLARGNPEETLEENEQDTDAPGAISESEDHLRRQDEATRKSVLLAMCVGLKDCDYGDNKFEDFFKKASLKPTVAQLRAEAARRYELFGLATQEFRKVKPNSGWSGKQLIPWLKEHPIQEARCKLFLQSQLFTTVYEIEVHSVQGNAASIGDETSNVDMERAAHDDVSEEKTEQPDDEEEEESNETILYNLKAKELLLELEHLHALLKTPNSVPLSIPQLDEMLLLVQEAHNLAMSAVPEVQTMEVEPSGLSESNSDSSLPVSLLKGREQMGTRRYEWKAMREVAKSDSSGSRLESVSSMEIISEESFKLSQCSSSKSSGSPLGSIRSSSQTNKSRSPHNSIRTPNQTDKSLTNSAMSLDQIPEDVIENESDERSLSEVSVPHLSNNEETVDIRVEKTRLVDERGNSGLYTGGCLKRNVRKREFKRRPNGEGRMEYTDGSVYEGGWHNGTWRGHGQISYKNGDKYSGEVVNFQYQGYGKLQEASRDEYEGEWKGGQRWGRGIQESANGDTYDGEWVENKRNGHGRFESRHDGIKTVYIGNWVDNRRHGKGVFDSSARWTLEGEWVAGKCIQFLQVGDGVRDVMSLLRSQAVALVEHEQSQNLFLSLGGIQWLLDIAREQSTDDLALEQICQICSILAHHDGIRDQLATEGWIKHLLALSRKHFSKEGFQAGAYRLVATITSSKEDPACQQFCQNSGVEWSLDISRLHSEHVDVQKSVLTVLTPLSESHDHVMKRIAEAGGLQRMFDVSREYLHNSIIQEHVFRILASASSRDEQGKVQTLCLSRLQWILDVTRDHPESEVVVAKAFEIIGNLAEWNMSTARQVQALGTIEWILLLCEGHIAREDVQFQAFRALGNLVAPNARRQIVSLDWIIFMLEAMKIHEGKAPIVLQIFRTFSHVRLDDQEVRLLLKSLQWVKQLFDMSEQHEDNTEIQQQVFSIIADLMSGDGDTCGQALACGLMDRVLRVSKEHENSIGIQEHIFRVIATASSEVKIDQKALPTNFFQWISTIAKKHADRASFQEIMLRALANLIAQKARGQMESDTMVRDVLYISEANKESSTIQKLCFQVMTVIGFEEMFRSLEVRLKDGIPFLLRVSRMHIGQEDLQERVLQQIVNAANNGGVTACREIVAHEGVKHILDVSRSYNGNGLMQMHVFAVLASVVSYNLAARRQVVSLGGVQHLKEAYELYMNIHIFDESNVVTLYVLNHTRTILQHCGHQV